jgi:tetratricopeptide (TPR) repeat protein
MTALLCALLLVGPGPDEAERAYAAGRYEEAIAHYQEALLEPGASRGTILYNLGNCAYRLGRHAEAVLYYRRALVRLPHDPEVQFNLALARQHLRLDDSNRESLGATIKAMVAHFAPRELLALVGFTLVAGLTGLVLLRRRAAARNTMVLIVLLALAGAARLVHDQWLERPAGIVLGRAVVLRSEPHRDLPATLELEAGESVRIEELSDRWARIVHPKGSGWTERAGIGVVD